MDTAILSAEDIDSLLQWRDQNRGLVREARAPLKSIMIICPGGTIRAFRSDGELNLYLNRAGKSLGYVRLRKLPGGMWAEIKSTLEIPKEDKQSMLTVYSSLMALMVYGNGEDDYPLEPKTPAEPVCGQKKRKAKKKQRRSVTYILRKSGGGIYAAVRGSRESPKGIFTVRGHWRRYKSGKEIWISEYKKGTGKRKGKTYKPGF